MPFPPYPGAAAAPAARGFTELPLAGQSRLRTSNVVLRSMRRPVEAQQLARQAAVGTHAGNRAVATAVEPHLRSWPLQFATRVLKSSGPRKGPGQEKTEFG